MSEEPNPESGPLLAPATLTKGLDAKAAEFIREALQHPLDDAYIDFLLAKGRELPELDYKLTVDISKNSDFAKIAKHIFAMANYGGGWIMIGFKEDRKEGYPPVGLPQDFHIDSATLQEKFNSYVDEPVRLDYREFTREAEVDLSEGRSRKTVRLAAIFVPPSTKVMVPVKSGRYTTPNGKEKSAFEGGQVLIRRGTQSVTAGPDEVKLIEERIRSVEYASGLISGFPDRISETLYSNVLPILRMPERVFSAMLVTEDLPEEVFHSVLAYKQYPPIYSFEDPRLTVLQPHIDSSSVKVIRTEEWTKEKERLDILFWLLVEAVVKTGRTRGMKYQRLGRKLYYPLKPGEETREAAWAGLSKSATRVVAWRMYAAQLRRKIGVHASISVGILQIGNRFFLRLTPSYVLTSDGAHPLIGVEEGTVITRLSYDDYNKTYLRNVLFWIDQFIPKGGVVKLAQGFEVSNTPLLANVRVGIRGDRPTLEILKQNLEEEGKES